MKPDRFMAMWEQAKDLTFGEMREVLEAAEKAATEKLFEIRKEKFRKAGERQPLTAEQAAAGIVKQYGKGLSVLAD